MKKKKNSPPKRDLIEGWFDGCCEPRNPGGHGSWGALLKKNGRVIWKSQGYCGFGPTISNNVAEYSGFIALLQEAQNQFGDLIIRGDSKLVVCQIGGSWKIHGGLYVPFYWEAKALWKYQELFRKGCRLTIEWIPRDDNSECDVLSKGVLHERGIEFRIQPDGDWK